MATLTLPGADIRGYYAELGIPLPGSAHTEASVRCFANPSAHRRGDRKPSCSVNLEHGAWNCHGCGKKGGAFDAATAKGHTDRSAIDLMVHYGITTHKRERERRRPPRPPRATRHARSFGEQPQPRTLTISETDVQRWQSELDSHTALIARLARDRGWRYETMRELELGIDHARPSPRPREAARRAAALPALQCSATEQDASRRRLAPGPAAPPRRRNLPAGSLGRGRA
jgi:hypothetical protein